MAGFGRKLSTLYRCDLCDFLDRVGMDFQELADEGVGVVSCQSLQQRPLDLGSLGNVVERHLLPFTLPPKPGAETQVHYPPRRPRQRSQRTSER